MGQSKNIFDDFCQSISHYLNILSDNVLTFNNGSKIDEEEGEC